ncbi:hypothetical protein [Nitrospirillum sp. BR 11163]|uniref:hypothetical protein n=1 Tax=Nitrospirillum sp. BR 11163 TaxID=3104323 RepID=UPI002AFEEBEF|nr:hypothetical protein [Nitrospirillum sp. BR 11163]MEA1676580.1 hypothetical protein [Nitrospirillum sp. BR 11163]
MLRAHGGGQRRQRGVGGRAILRRGAMAPRSSVALSAMSATVALADQWVCVQPVAGCRADGELAVMPVISAVTAVPVVALAGTRPLLAVAAPLVEAKGSVEVAKGETASAL